MNIIDRAADRLRGRWHQGDYSDSYSDSDGNVCIIAALQSVGIEADDAASLAVYRVLQEETGIRSAVTFNDDPATTEEDVLLLLKKASVLYDERVSP